MTATFGNIEAIRYLPICLLVWKKKLTWDKLFLFQTNDLRECLRMLIDLKYINMCLYVYMWLSTLSLTNTIFSSLSRHSKMFFFFKSISSYGLTKFSMQFLMRHLDLLLTSSISISQQDGILLQDVVVVPLLLLLLLELESLSRAQY